MKVEKSHQLDSLLWLYWSDLHDHPYAVYECPHAVHECPHAGYDSPTTFPIPHTTEIDPWIDRSTVTTNTTKFYSKTLSYWLPDHCRSFPDRADFQDVSTMLPRLHEPTMPMSTIFHIVEIGTARSAQCDLGFTGGLYFGLLSCNILDASFYNVRLAASVIRDIIAKIIA